MPSTRKTSTSRTTRRREQSRDEILDAARAVLLRDGWLGFGLGAVADELGLTKPALYHYFPSKERLVLEVVLHEQEEVAKAVAEAVGSATDAPGALEAQIRTFIDYFTPRMPLFQLAFLYLPLTDPLANGTPDDLRRIRPTNALIYGLAEDRIREAQQAGAANAHLHARQTAFCAITSAIGLLTMRSMVESANDPLLHAQDDLVDTLCAVFRTAAATKELP